LPSSRRSVTASSTSPSAGSGSGVGGSRTRHLAERYGVHPSKALGQNFLIDPNVARAIVRDADVRDGDRVIEIGAGFGSLTLALAAAGARVVAVEFDRAVVPALREVVGSAPGVVVVEADAMRLDWDAVLGRGDEPWTLCANLPYNIATPLVLDVLAGVGRVRRLVVMVQREVGERLVARPGDDAYGAVSVRVAARATASLVRRVVRDVFWPRPKVDSAIVRIDRLAEPLVGSDDPVWSVVDEAFGQRRKTIRNALRRLGVDDAEGALRAAGLAPSARPEELSLGDFMRLAAAIG
jgi:16S rRNA (adenine1518-N6/adenine1519-N6)-dimethyltransferase